MVPIKALCRVRVLVSTVMALRDFSSEERAWLSSPHAEEALRAVGVHYQHLRPRAVESFEEAIGGLKATVYEQKRQFHWRLFF